MAQEGQELINLIKANTKIIQIISYETLLIHANLANAASELGRELYLWDRVAGIKKWDTENRSWVMIDEDARQPERPFSFFDEHKDIILLLEDFHPDMTENQPQNIKRLRNAAMGGNEQNRTLVLSQPFRFLPRELEKEVHIIELPPPSYEDLEVIFKNVCESFKIPIPDDPEQDLIEAALGLTIMEAEKAFSLAYIKSGQLTSAEVPLVIREKENVIKKSGYLEYFHPKEELKDVGGLDTLKDWLAKRGRAFEKGAADFGLTYPRGILLLGIPGTGKSLTAKAIGNLWHFPLLRLDMGKIFGGIVGESESNIRGALNIAEAIAPSILWIDEIEKAMSGISSSGRSDGGTTSRVLGTFLTWMQEKTKPVFVVATANDISQLPPELLRKGRVDEIFFVDLPVEDERKEIIKIHLQKKNRKPDDDFDLAKLAQKSKGFSGAELEEAVKEALFRAFDEGRTLRDDDILNAISKTFPLARTMHETISEMRKWAQSRAVAASSKTPEPLDEWQNDNIPKLRQETYSNPFLKAKEK
ncbi:ATPase [Spirochaetia bacterium]|nr:ATPase [Spirochaetia bacterium]GHU30679.1 ATPase [Spirochaetia bacterium]